MPSAGHGADTVRILLVDRDDTAGQLLADNLGSVLAIPPAIVQARCGRDAATQLRARSSDIVLLDLASLADLSPEPEDAVARLVKVSAGALVIAIADGASISASMAAMRAGAHDYISRPLAGRAFAARIRELGERHGKAPALCIETPAETVGSFEGLVGASSQMQVVYEQIERIAGSDAPVFITGESGTGKNRCAEALHARGPRSSRTLATVSCKQTPRERIEAHLFGVARGALGGDDRERAGIIELADGGTLFLDEVAELDLSVQARLLRLLQTGTVSRLGEATARRVNVRVICSSGENPMQLIGERKFREDLFYRLHVLPIHMPPLRQRIGDIPLLARHFVESYAAEAGKHFAGLAPDATSLLIERDWHGNVGQLQELMRRVVTMNEGGEITAHMLSEAGADGAGNVRPTPLHSRRNAILPMWRQEQRIIEEAIASFGGNITLAAQALELSPSTIYRKRQAWAEMEVARGAA